MSVMQKLLEINDHLVRTLAECEQLRSDQKTLQEICSIGRQRITELQTELRKAYAERDEAVEHAGRLQAELDATRKQLQDVLFEQEDISSAEPAGQSDLVRDVSHYIEAAEVDRPTTIHPPEYTPPEGWRVLAVGEALRDGDVTVRADGYQYPTERVGSVVGANQRYIRPIEPQAEPEPQPVQDGVLVQEGWWLRADGNRVYVRPTNPSPDNIWRINIGFKWSDGARLYMDDGSHNRNQTTPHDLVKFLGNRVKTQPAESQQSQPEPVLEPQQYTPPQGWRVLAVGEMLQKGDQIVQLHDGKRFPTERVGQYVCETQRYIRLIEPEPEPVQVREGRWRTRGGDIRNVTPTPDDDERATKYPWYDAKYDQTWQNNGRYYLDEENRRDLVEYLGPIEEQPQPQPEPEFKPYTFAAYIVGDKIQPDALRIVWATEEWIQHAKFGIVHRISDLQFSGNDTFTPDQFSVNLKIQ